MNYFNIPKLLLNNFYFNIKIYDIFYQLCKLIFQNNIKESKNMFIFNIYIYINNEFNTHHYFRILMLNLLMI